MADDKHVADAFQALHDEQDKVAREMEGRIGIPDGTFHQLPDDASDWSFLIELRAVVEAAIATVVTRKLGEDAIKEFVHRLNVNGQTGKIELARALDVITPQQAEYVRALASVCNQFAHRIEHLGGSLREYSCGKHPNGGKTLLTDAAARTQTAVAATSLTTLEQPTGPQFVVVRWAVGSVDHVTDERPGSRGRPAANPAAPYDGGGGDDKALQAAT